MPHDFNKQSQCDPQRAKEFLNSDHYDLEDHGFMAHLDTCQACRTELESQAGDDSQWQRAMELLKPTEFDDASRPDFSSGTHVGLEQQLPPSVRDVLDSLTPSEDPDHLGRLGPYEVTGVFGVGGMGVVLKAVDPSLDRIVAVKVMSPRLATSTTARQRFAREAKAAAAVLHPNVVAIHSVSSESKLPYLVMACIRGGSLQKRLETEGPLPLVEVLRIGSQIAAGLQAAHEQGLVHRDIKPENILLEEGVERVTITDFGLARAVDDNTVTRQGAIAGTPQYMSPEQARGEQVDQQSDLFSLGSVLYALCTGSAPYRDDTSYGVMRRIIDEAPTPIKELNKETPEWLICIIERLMSKPKADRFESAQELHDLLESCLSHVQQPAANPLPVSLKHRTKIYRRKRNLMKLFFAGALVASLVLGLFSMKEYIERKFNGPDHRVIAPLSAAESYVQTMMLSAKDPDCVFLNIGNIGSQSNYLSLKPSVDGIVLTYNVFDQSPFSKRQGQFVSSLRQSAAALGFHLSEASAIDTSGAIEGVTLKFFIAGEPPKSIAGKIIQLVSDSFGIDRTSECKFAFQNLPVRSVMSGGPSPKQVSADEFVAAFDAGSHVYAGEVQNTIYIGPPEAVQQSSVPWNDSIYWLQVKELSQQDLKRIRLGGSLKSRNRKEQSNEHLDSSATTNEVGVELEN